MLYSGKKKQKQKKIIGFFFCFFFMIFLVGFSAKGLDGMKIGEGEGNKGIRTASCWIIFYISL